MTSEQTDRPEDPEIPTPDAPPPAPEPHPEPGPEAGSDATAPGPEAAATEPRPADPEPAASEAPQPEPEEPEAKPEPEEPKPEPRTKPTTAAAEAAAASAAKAVEVGSAGLHAAVSVFTWLPVPPVHLDRDTARRAMLALPWVGLGAGLVAGTLAAIVLMLGAGDLLAALVGLGVLALVSGAMHLVGLAKTTEALGSGKPAAAALALMKTPGIGVLGAVGVFFALGVDTAALASPNVAGSAVPAALIVAPLVGRVAAYAGTGRWARAARPDGLGARFAGVTTDLALLATGLAAVAVAVLVGVVAQGPRGMAVFLLATLVTWTLAAIWQRHVQRRLGGVTGDTLGALVELGQAMFLVVLALAL